MMDNNNRLNNNEKTSLNIEKGRVNNKEDDLSVRIAETPEKHLCKFISLYDNELDEHLNSMHVPSLNFLSLKFYWLYFIRILFIWIFYDFYFDEFFV